MNRLQQANTLARPAWCGWAAVCIFAMLGLRSTIDAQTTGKAEYQVYVLQHKPASDVEKMLGEMLADLGGQTHLVADPRANKILLRGPEQAQQIARQLIDSVDQPPQTTTQPPLPAEVKAYPCTQGRQEEVAKSLRTMYADRPGVRIATDPKKPQLLVLAPPEIHAAIPEQLALLGVEKAGSSLAAQPPTLGTETTAPASNLVEPKDRAANGIIPFPLREDHEGTLPVPGRTDKEPPAFVARKPAASSLPGPSQVSPPSAPKEHFVPLIYSRVDQLEPMLRDLFGKRLEPVSTRQSNRIDYVLANAAGQSITLGFDRSRNGIAVFGPEPAAGQVVRLIQIVDAPRQPAGKTMRVMPLHNADPGKVQQAVEAYRSGYLEGSKTPPPATGRPRTPQETNPKRLDNRQSRRYVPGVIRLTAYQAPAGAGEAQPPPAPEQPGQARKEPGPEPPPTEADAEERRRRLRELGVDVEIEALPELDVIILRGRDRDVDEVRRIIEEIERISAETEPVIEVYQLQHASSQTVGSIAEKVRRELLANRQGRVSVTPLTTPNALLLIGWGEAVDWAKRLIAALDQPTTPGVAIRVFPLKHAAASTVATTVQTFFATRAGLGGEAKVSADIRTNSVVVEAAPRDMVEVATLIERLDRGSGEAVVQARVFRLENSLAYDVARVLQGAIQAARGGTTGQKSAALELFTFDARGQRVLRSGALNDVDVTADPRTNTLIVSAPAESMDLLAALIKQLDTPSAVAQIKVFRIVNGDANAMVQMLRNLLPTPQGPGGAQLAGAEGESSLVPIRFSVDQRTNSIIATGSEGDLKIIEALLVRLDERDVQQRKNTVYRLKNAPALDVAEAINFFLRSERQVQQAAPGTLSPFQQIESEVIVVPEPVSNGLIISATPRFFNDIMELVTKLDAEPPQVMIQVLIAEVDLTNFHEFGIELGLQDSVLFDRSLLGNLVTTTNTTQQSTPSGIITSTEQTIVAASNEPGFNFNNRPLGNSGSTKALSNAAAVGTQGLSHFSLGRINNELGFGGLVLSASSESVSVLIRALQECRRLEVISRPQVMTLDNQPAFIQVGKRVPRITGTTINQVGQVNNITLENVGLILGVTPRISPDGLVVMEIDAEKSEVGPVSEGIPVSISEGVEIRSPSIDVATAQTTVSAADGDTIVLGGLITKNTRKTTRRVPGLADIPVLGHLFRYDSSTENRAELLIILTPHVVRTPADADRVKQAEAARMHWCLADVNKIHGPTGIRDPRSIPNGDVSTPVIYPDLNPRGAVTPPAPLNLNPGAPPNSAPAMPEVIPPGTNLGVPPDAAPPAPSPPPMLNQIFHNAPTPPAQGQAATPTPPRPVMPAAYTQPIPLRATAESAPKAVARPAAAGAAPPAAPPVPEPMAFGAPIK